MTKSTIWLIAGARPNFMKIAPIIRALQARPERFSWKLVHTGQHYDRDMSDIFFKELGIPKPNYHLEAGGGTHAEQTGKIMVEFERICSSERPDHIIVVGDVNSTLACSITAKKLGITVSHVEAGLRSFDMAMPEEINRLVTDSISDWFFCTESVAIKHLTNEGKSPEAMFFVGHVMIDTLLYEKAKLDKAPESVPISDAFKQKYKTYGVVTLHRPSNVDDVITMTRLGAALKDISQDLPLIFPVHPRTAKNIDQNGIDLGDNVIMIPPLGYIEFLNLWRDATIVLTDSGGLQEETTGLGVPCLTMRENTERPITITEGTNILVGTDRDKIVNAARSILSGDAKVGSTPAFWDGKAAERIIDHLDRLLA